MKTQYYTSASPDGFLATEDDSLEWLFPLGSLTDSSYPEFISKVGALAMGSATYEWMLWRELVELGPKLEGQTTVEGCSDPQADGLSSIQLG